MASTEDGIRRFLVRETCVGVRPQECFSPNGLSGLYAGTLTPNPATPYPHLFDTTVASDRARWDWLRIRTGYQQTHVGVEPL
ncbi:nucleotidyltransferase family protein [Luteitalea sp.]|uniref:nucleotidyltransferase family protein n=1 Tax=Luteitalea sp. TaxID=2004800 RepID=UPI0025BDB1EF|nr:nucleotidyltransferase family protein [Luteitalea sp.]